MPMQIVRWTLLTTFVSILTGCALLNPVPHIPSTSESVIPGTSVTRAGQPQRLLGDPVRVGDTLPSLNVTDRTMQLRSLDELRGRTLLISIAPSLDTQVCERQTHLLGEASYEELPQSITRVSITRDLPFAQNRFDEHTGFTDVIYLSDYRRAEFGLGTGLLMEDLRLLARAVMVVDAKGTIRYLQIVPEVAHLPDMAKAFAVAREVAAE